MDDLLFNECPEAWHAWPCDVEVFFILTPSTCVYRSLYEEYYRNQWREIAETVFAPSNTKIFLGYRVVAAGFIPAFEWFVTWPVQRKGDSSGYSRRQNVQGANPFDYESDKTIYAIWNRPNGMYGFTQTYMLTVGGRTKDEAASNWEKCVVPFRKILKKVRAS